MAKMSMLCFVLALAVAGALLFPGDRVLAQACQVDIPSLLNQCNYFFKIPGPPVPPSQPSQPCCAAVQHTDIPCACTYVTPDIEQVINTSRVVLMAEKCGRPLAHGSKCGSYTVPPN